MLTQLKLTVLSENRVVNPRLIAEQGLSILVETPGGNILFDTGQMYALIHNAQQLQTDLSKLQAVVLSHGHYDMTGGLPHLLKLVHPLKVVCHPNLFNKKYKIINGERVDIGVPWEKAEMEEIGAIFILKTHPWEVIPHVWISGEIPRLTDYEYIEESYQERVLESYIHDELHDDMALIIKTVKGLVVLMGCGHSGTINTLKHAMRITGESRIHAVVGGMHLHRAPDEKIEKVVEHLIPLNPDYLIPLHCCGFRTINKLYNLFKKRVLLFNVGDTFSLETG
ncbi:MAG: MBL fold metallo-hydrolase [Calditrichia bacterium]